LIKLKPSDKAKLEAAPLPPASGLDDYDVAEVQDSDDEGPEPVRSTSLNQQVAAKVVEEEAEPEPEADAEAEPEPKKVTKKVVKKKVTA